MTPEERIYFKKLMKDRSQSADVLEKPSLRGTKDSVVEKYSDQAHFIYELLQNADDAGATSARFILEHDQLIFAHNGDKLFSVSDPANEDMDTANGTLGHVNAITSIANSNKSGASIGKFGVGFKAVFQYTTTPHIYDPKIRFKIDRFIVPELLSKDFPGRKKNETLFVFPFNHPERSDEEAFEDISDKLTHLVYPILFLHNLKSVTYVIDGVKGSYSKYVKESFEKDDTLVERLNFVNIDGDVKTENGLWLFTRNLDHGLSYSVGFSINKDGKLVPIKETAFCYFPTKENTGLNFLIHAPFLLTDSREGIRAGVKHNELMISHLAELAAQSMMILRDIGVEKGIRLIDDAIINIIPVIESDFSPVGDKRQVSFKPIFDEIKSVFMMAQILPTKDGYCSSKQAYWAEIPQTTEVFSDEQLASICNVKEAHWVFRSFGRSQYVHQRNMELVTYIEDIVYTSIDELAIIRGRGLGWAFQQGRKKRVMIPGISEEFIIKQSLGQLCTIYKWLSETETRTEAVKTIPVFISQEGKVVAAYDKKNQPILFLPERDMTGYVTVREDFLKNRNTKKLLEKLKVKKPVIKNQIYNIILPQYAIGVPADTNPHFSVFFKYFKSCPNEELDNFISMIKNCKFLQCYSSLSRDLQYEKADRVYLPEQNLIDYFEGKPATVFLDLDNYKNLLGASSEKLMYRFFEKLGVRSKVSIVEREISLSEAKARKLPSGYSTREERWGEYVIDGCKECIEQIISQQDREKSVLLWNMLLNLLEEDRNLESRLIGRYFYFYHKSQIKTFASSDIAVLRQNPWLMSKNGKWIAPEKMKATELADCYNLDSVYASSLFRLLSITEKNRYAEEDRHLNDRQKKQIELGRILEKLGYTEKDLDELARWKRQKELMDEKNKQRQDSTRTEAAGKDKEPEEVIKIPKRIDKTTSQVIKDIVGRTNRKSSQEENPANSKSSVRIPDADEFSPEIIDYSKMIEEEKKKSVAEIERIAYLENLQKKAALAKRYSLGWFKALLNLEIQGYNGNDFTNREISIRFGLVEREPDTQRTLILKNPSMNIPQFMEDLSDIPLYLQMESETKKLVIEVMNVKSYTLRIKIRKAETLNDIDFSKVKEAKIEAKSPVFLLDALREELGKLKMKDTYDMQANLSKKIKFIFGPPGTGKTTYLAKEVLIPLMLEKKGLKVLVLTPTNKSADVLTERIMEVMGRKLDYRNWLVRFGATNEERIEKAGVFKERDFDIRSLESNITVTTIARFPYDFFMPDRERLYLRDIKWDVMVFDEASMIPLVNIIYPLYKKSPKEFIIAGDPFQIEPITSVEQWKDENIYKMVHLDSFVEQNTVPHSYKVELLSTQYRCVPEIGDVFSRLTYGGILKHYRKSEDKKPLELKGKLDLEALNLIKFPVSKYESIYKAKRLQHSSCYQIYSALFTYEFVQYMASLIRKKDVKGIYRIGVIAPYRAQSDLIQKLMESSSLPKHVEVLVGTIHGFQGDECDTIISVFNPPPTISASPNMFLNKQNIINVSISRARDHLIILMPDEKTEQIENLRLVNRVEQLCLENGAKVFETENLESLMFGIGTYLEDNTFTTSHQNVNVYSVPEKCYEIRSEDSAIDIQVHGREKG